MKTIKNLKEANAKITGEDEEPVVVPDKQISDKILLEEELAENNSPDLVPGTEADVTMEDLENLGPKELNLDMGDDEDLKHRIFPIDFAGSDLDVPGTELDDENEKLGSEDEENNLYSFSNNT